MKILRADLKDVNAIHDIVHSTIKKIYPKYYPEGVVQFFLNHHSLENIKKAIDLEYIFLIEFNGNLIGTGTLAKNEIKRMFILPQFQGRGYGKILLDELEKQATNKGNTNVFLDSSLPAFSLYEKRGYVSIKYNKLITDNGQVLCYNTLTKELNNLKFPIDYNNKIFTSICNSDNGEVSGDTIFKYKQKDDVIWAEYSGGEIVKGYLIGTIDKESNLNFCYEHINKQKEVRTGKCKSIPQIMPDGRVKLIEEWEWTNGDKSKGSSVIEEINIYKENVK